MYGKIGYSYTRIDGPHPAHGGVACIDLMVVYVFSIVANGWEYPFLTWCLNRMLRTWRQYQIVPASNVFISRRNPFGLLISGSCLVSCCSAIALHQTRSHLCNHLHRCDVCLFQDDSRKCCHPSIRMPLEQLRLHHLVPGLGCHCSWRCLFEEEIDGGFVHVFTPSRLDRPRDVLF